jgi:hypothetical protein
MKYKIAERRASSKKSPEPSAAAMLSQRMNDVLLSMRQRCSSPRRCDAERHCCEQFRASLIRNIYSPRARMSKTKRAERDAAKSGAFTSGKRRVGV